MEEQGFKFTKSRGKLQIEEAGNNNKIMLKMTNRIYKAKIITMEREVATLQMYYQQLTQCYGMPG